MKPSGSARTIWRRVLLKALALPVSRRRAMPLPDATARSGTGRVARDGGLQAEAGGAGDGRGLRILVIRPDHLGDLLLTGPALALLRAALPAATITALVGPWARPALVGRPEIDALRTCTFPGFTREPAGSLLAPYWQLAAEGRRLRRGRYDAALVLRVDHWWGAALAAYAGIPLRVGYGVPESRDFLTHALPPDVAQHSVEENWRVVAALLELLGCPLPEGGPGPVTATASPAGQVAAARFLAERGVAPDAPLVALHPGTGADVKLWPAARWSAVADALARRLDARIVVTGSAGERALVAKVIGGMAGGAVDAAGALDWDALAGLFARCALVLGVDSGPLHLAAALGVPTVHVFGPTAPARFGPRGSGTHLVVRAPLPCSPCGNLIAPPCGARTEPACLQAVLPEAVVDAALAAVGEAGGASTAAGRKLAPAANDATAIGAEDSPARLSAGASLSAIDGTPSSAAMPAGEPKAAQSADRGNGQDVSGRSGVAPVVADLPTPPATAPARSARA